MTQMARRRSASLLVAAEGDLAVLRDAVRPTGRLLRQGDMDASYVDLADPRHLEFDYLRWMAVLADAVDARDIVHVGGAGCALARALAAGRPDRRQEVVEVDAAVVELARAHLGLRRGGVAAINVVDARGLPDTRAIAAGMRAAFETVIALGAAPVLHARRTGNVVLAAAHGDLPLERVRARAAADRSPALLLDPEEVRSLTCGTPPWSDPPAPG
jgi:hypothetical protein